MPRIVVIGAGVMGASVAYRLAIAGAAVTVLEAGRVGGGTSGCSFAWTNSSEKTPRAYHDLNVAGMKAHAALAEELGATPWWHGGGNVEWTAPESRTALQAKVERLLSWGYAAEWITPAQLLELEPDIDPAVIGDAPIAYYPEEGWLDPVVYAAAMLGLARSRGASVICGIPCFRHGHARWSGHWGENGGRQAVRRRHGGELCRPVGERSGVGCRPASAPGTDRRVPGVHPAGWRPRWAGRARADDPGKAGRCGAPRAALERDGRDACLRSAAERRHAGGARPRAACAQVAALDR